MTLESLSTSSAAVAAATLLLLDQYSSSVDDLVFSFLIHPWLRRCRINRFYAERRRYYERKKWSVFSERLTERQFVRYFRMSKGLFEKLCNKIEGSVGSARFKSEEYLDNILNPPGPVSEYTNNQWKNIIFAHPAQGQTLGVYSTYLKYTIRYQSNFQYQVEHLRS